MTGRNRESKRGDHADRTRISTAEMAARVVDPERVVVDVRPRAAYNGWRLADEPRGGHVPGARSLPGRWLDRADPATLVERKGITRDDSLTLYGYTGRDARTAATVLREAGYEDVAVHPGFVEEWVADPQRPLDRLERYRHLVSPAWLRTLVRGGTPREYSGGEYVLCHVHADEYADYERGHVPGALPLDTGSLENPTDWNRRSPAELGEALRTHGIRHDTTVVLYGRPADSRAGEASCSGGSAGHLGAMRCAVLMLYAGVEDVRILDGGLAAWNAAGFETSTEPTEPRGVESFGRDVPARPEFIVDRPGAEALLASDRGTLVSVRSKAEFLGDTSGYEYVTSEGRIPGSTFGNCGSDPYHMENYRTVDERMRESRAVAAEWADNGIVPEADVAFYCGTGWRGSEAFVHAYLMGWTDIAVYDGGWHDWCTDPDTPIERGPPADTADWEIF